MTEAPVYSLWTSVVTCLSTVSQHLAGLSLGKISDTAQTEAWENSLLSQVGTPPQPIVKKQLKRMAGRTQRL